MEKLKLDTGEQAFRVGGGVLRFNPCDPALYQRFLEAADMLDGLQPKDIGEADRLLRQHLSAIFPGNDFSAMFPGSLLALCGNGKLLVQNFLEALEPVLTAGARRYAQSL